MCVLFLSKEGIFVFMDIYLFFAENETFIDEKCYDGHNS